MAGYAKLFSEIVDSSIWDESPETCKVWITLLALADQDGYVRGSEGWLAGKSRVSLGKCVLALRTFTEPDVRSRTMEHQGRRIEILEDGWLVLNYIKFRDRLSTDPKTVATRLRVQKHRERYKALQSVTSGDSASASVQGIGVERKGNGLSEVERIELGQALNRGLKKLEQLERGRPYPTGSAELAELKRLRTVTEEMKGRLGLEV
jgi:hypothetical protein